MYGLDHFRAMGHRTLPPPIDYHHRKYISDLWDILAKKYLKDPVSSGKRSGKQKQPKNQNTSLIRETCRWGFYGLGMYGCHMKSWSGGKVEHAVHVLELNRNGVWIFWVLAPVCCINGGGVWTVYFQNRLMSLTKKKSSQALKICSIRCTPCSKSSNEQINVNVKERSAIWR